MVMAPSTKFAVMRWRMRLLVRAAATVSPFTCAARIAFQVASRMDSRVVLDEMGADKLLGKGDMLYMAPETSTLQRAQGTYVSDDEVNKVIAFFADQEPQYDEELAQLKAAPAAAGKGGKGGVSTEHG